MAKYSSLTDLFSAIANALRNKTGGTGRIVAEDFPAVIDTLSVGGITPSGTKIISSNGTHDVAAYANAEVNVPTGVAPSGTISITENGTFDVAGYANALVNVPGMNVKLYNIGIANDITSGTAALLTNDWLKSLRNDPDAFVLMRYLGVAPSTAMISFWFTANFVFYYSGATAYNSLIARATASTSNLNGNMNGLPGDNYNGHLNIDSNGRLWAIPNATYPIKAGQYQIIAGTMDVL